MIRGGGGNVIVTEVRMRHSHGQIRRINEWIINIKQWQQTVAITKMQIQSIKYQWKHKQKYHRNTHNHS